MDSGTGLRAIRLDSLHRFVGMNGEGRSAVKVYTGVGGGSRIKFFTVAVRGRLVPVYCQRHPVLVLCGAAASSRRTRR